MRKAICLLYPPETDVDKGSSDSDIDEAPAKPAAKEYSENHDD